MISRADISFFELKGKPVAGRNRIVSTGQWMIRCDNQTLGYYYSRHGSIAMIVGMLEEEELVTIAECVCHEFGVEGIETPRNARVTPMVSEYEAPEDFGDF